MFEQENTKKQGDVGLGAAIAWFTSNEYTVSIPLTDSQDYDLIVDKTGIVSRVQVKTSSYKRNDNYYVQLSVKGGNKSGTGKIKKFDKNRVELVFVLTDDGGKYLIPSTEIEVKNHYSLTNDRIMKYKV